MHLIKIKAGPPILTLQRHMWKFRQILWCLVLSLSLAGGGLLDSMARAAVPAVGQAVVICADGGVATLILDPKGNPITPAKGHVSHCPDCLNVSASVLPTAALQPTVNGKGHKLPALAFVQQRVINVASPHQARAPPKKV